MRINIDLATAGVASVTCATNGSCAHVLKRRDSVPVEIAFIAADGTGPAALTAPNITVALRTAGSYSGNPLALETTWTYSTTKKAYEGTLDLNTDEMTTAFTALAASADDNLAAALEVSWSLDAGTTWLSTPRIDVTVENDVVTGSESPPSTTAQPWEPPSLGTNGQVLTTDGTNATWETVTHNTLANLQGGTTGEYYHLTSAQHTALGTPNAHAASHAVATSTTFTRSAAIQNFTADDMVVPAGTYTLTFACTAHSNTGESGYIILDSTTDAFTDLTSVSKFQYAEITDNSYGTGKRIRCKIGDQSPYPLPQSLVATLVTTGATLKLTGTLVDGSDTATFTLALATAAGTDPLFVRSDAIIDAGLPGCVPLLGSNATLPLANGGTGSATAPLARAALGITSTGDSVVTAASLEALNALLDSNRGKNCTVVVESDFFSVGNTAIPGLAGGAISNGMSVLSGTTDRNHPGLVTLQSGTNANSGYYYGSAGGSGLLICGREKATLVFYVATSVTTTYWRFGFMDSFSVDPTDGVFLLVQGDGTGATATGRVVSNGSITDTATTYGLSLATFYSVVVEVNAAATLATFSIYSEAGALLWSDTAANLPTTANRHTSLGLVAYCKDASSNQVLVAVDYVRWEIGRNLTR